MPMAIEVPLSNGHRVGVIHAELPPTYSWQEVEGLKVEVNDALDEGHPAVSSLLWSN